MAIARQPDAPKWRSYTDQERGEAVGLALAIGAKRAAEQLGIPRRTISSWLRTPTPAVQGALVVSEEAIRSSLEAAASSGSASLLAIIQDPKTPPRVKVDAIQVALQQWTLLSGRATSRVETSTGPELTYYEQAELRRFLDTLEAASDDELREWAAAGGLQALRDGEANAKQLVAGEEAAGGPLG